MSAELSPLNRVKDLNKHMFKIEGSVMLVSRKGMCTVSLDLV